MQYENNDCITPFELEDMDDKESSEPLIEVSTRMMTIKYMLDKEWSTALGWALRNGSTELISKVATKVLKHAGAEQISMMRIFDARSEAFLVTPELVILYKFYTYKRHLYRGELQEAMVNLHQLFVDNSSPPEFRAVLFDEMIKMLKGVSETMGHPETMLPGLNKSAVLDLLRSISVFEQQQRVRMGSHPGQKNLNYAVQKQLNNLLLILRPMLCEALATASLT